jgi:hypothetical protein
MEDGPFQGDLERAVLQAAGKPPRKSNLERDNFRKRKKDEYTEYSHGNSSEARKGIAGPHECGIQ